MRDFISIPQGRCTSSPSQTRNPASRFPLKPFLLLSLCPECPSPPLLTHPLRLLQEATPHPYPNGKADRSPRPVHPHLRALSGRRPLTFADSHSHPAFSVLIRPPGRRGACPRWGRERQVPGVPEAARAGPLPGRSCVLAPLPPRCPGHRPGAGTEAGAGAANVSPPESAGPLSWWSSGRISAALIAVNNSQPSLNGRDHSH